MALKKSVATIMSKITHKICPKCGSKVALPEDNKKVICKSCGKEIVNE